MEVAAMVDTEVMTPEEFAMPIKEVSAPEETLVVSHIFKAKAIAFIMVLLVYMI